MQEIDAIARARRIALADTAVADGMKFFDTTTPPNATTSLQRDIVAGKASELEFWNGAVVRLGRESGIPTPVHEAIYSFLRPQELRARGEVTFPS
jgi:2-dehydropantoate 2-reductase